MPHFKENINVIVHHYALHNVDILFLNIYPHSLDRHLDIVPPNSVVI